MALLVQYLRLMELISYCTNKIDIFKISTPACILHQRKVSCVELNMAQEEESVSWSLDSLQFYLRSQTSLF